MALPAWADEVHDECGVVEEGGALSLHFHGKCSPEELKVLRTAIQEAVAQTERRSQVRPGPLRNWYPGSERNLGRLGEFSTNIPVSPLHR
jgi:hypothetical protein